MQIQYNLINFCLKNAATSVSWYKHQSETGSPWKYIEIKIFQWPFMFSLGSIKFLASENYFFSSFPNMVLYHNNVLWCWPSWISVQHKKDNFICKGPSKTDSSQVCFQIVHWSQCYKGTFLPSYIYIFCVVSVKKIF